MNRFAHVAADQKAMPPTCPMMMVPDGMPLRMRAQVLAARIR
jgi:hypothetical protein